MPGLHLCGRVLLSDIMKTIDILQPESVLCNVEARSRKHAIEVVAKLMCRAEEALADTDVFTSLIGRERLGCTALANGLAVPHARIPGLEKPVAALVKLTEPVEFDMADDTDVDLIFGLIVPETYTDPDGDQFRTLVHNLSDEHMLATLRAATSARALYSAVTAQIDTTAEDSAEPAPEAPTDTNERKVESG